MAIIKRYVSPNTIQTVSGVVSGDEPIFNINNETVITIEAVLESATGEAQTFATVKEAEPSNFSDMVNIGVPFEESYQDSNGVKGQSWVGIKVLSGTWTISVSSHIGG